MSTRPSWSRISLLFTITSFALGLVSIRLGKQVDYVEHLAVFNLLAAAMLGLAVIALVVSLISLVRTRGRGSAGWLAAVLATLVLASFLFDE